MVAGSDRTRPLGGLVMPRLPDTRPQVHATTDTPVHYGRPACIAQVHSVSGGRSIRWSLCASDEHGDGPAGVAVADLELLAGDLDAALAGDPSLHQDRALATANGLVARGGQAQRGSA